MPSFLIVDDSHEKIAMIRHYLKQTGYAGDILTAMTTEEALDVIDEQEAIAAAFVDYYIPRKNGPAVIRRLKQKFPDCRVALVSSADNAANAAEAKAAGAEVAICTTHRSDEVERQILDTLSDWQS